MRCGCPRCDAYMVHAESMRLGCVCPECGARCDACLGTNTVMSREAFQAMKAANKAQNEREDTPPPRER